MGASLNVDCQESHSRLSRLREGQALPATPCLAWPRRALPCLPCLPNDREPPVLTVLLGAPFADSHGEARLVKEVEELRLAQGRRVEGDREFRFPVGKLGTVADVRDACPHANHVLTHLRFSCDSHVLAVDMERAAKERHLHVTVGARANGGCLECDGREAVGPVVAVVEAVPVLLFRVLGFLCLRRHLHLLVENLSLRLLAPSVDDQRGLAADLNLSHFCHVSFYSSSLRVEILASSSLALPLAAIELTSSKSGHWMMRARQPIAVATSSAKSRPGWSPSANTRTVVKSLKMSFHEFFHPFAPG